MAPDVKKGNSYPPREYMALPRGGPMAKPKPIADSASDVTRPAYSGAIEVRRGIPVPQTSAPPSPMNRRQMKLRLANHWEAERPIIVDTFLTPPPPHSTNIYTHHAYIHAYIHTMHSSMHAIWSARFRKDFWKNQALRIKIILFSKCEISVQWKETILDFTTVNKISNTVKNVFQNGNARLVWSTQFGLVWKEVIAYRWIDSTQAT